MRRIYHRYELWEEIKFSMWDICPSKKRKQKLKAAKNFTCDCLLYGSYMIKVINKWKFSCEHNLTDINQNRQAWLGHAAVAMALQCPEDIVREAWGLLTEQQRINANKKADFAIKLWELKYEEKNKSIHKQMEITGI